MSWTWRMPSKPAAVLGCLGSLLAASCARDEPTQGPPVIVPQTGAEPTPGAVSATASAPVPAAPAKPPSSFGDSCLVLCARTRELRCPNAEHCPKACEEMAKNATCSGQLRLAMGCFARQPTSSWRCGDDGLAAVKPGHCEAEQARYLECIGQAVRP